MDPGSILVFTLHVSYFSASHADGYCQVIYRRSLHTIIGQLLSYQCKLNDFGFAFFRGLVAKTVLNRCGTQTLPIQYQLPPVLTSLPKTILPETWDTRIFLVCISQRF